ncbi:methyltransferase domain protein [Mycobacterium kansasii]|uniref:Methyltransferase domain protein n=1 Tax=Mycobacterium kansasii TaxID=1768 RepID=A0A1V3WU71_MYCKA|nr:methyltransferase domain protein [Mycobacterium kansasii]
MAPGSVTAVELTDDALRLGRAEAERRGAANVSFVTSDVHALDFPDDTFDVVHAHQVLQHVADPVQALREMRRVCAPGGVVAARDADYGGFIWYPRLPALDLWLRLYDGRLAPTAASRTRAGGCCPGRWRPASTTSRRPAASGVLRRPRPANGGAECGPTASCSRTCLVNLWTREWPQWSS